MFSDPQSITYNAVAKSLVCTGRTADQSTYELNDAGVKYKLTLLHQFKKRNRVVARLQRDSYASDPLVPAQNILASMTATVTFDFPNIGITTTDVGYLVSALMGWITSGTNIAKLANGET